MTGKTMKQKGANLGHRQDPRDDFEPLFEVWICEDDTGDGIDSWWETSKEEVRKADLVLVLYTGEAGSKVQDIGLGICHAELFEAAKYSREKVLTIFTLGDATAPSKLEDRSFQEYVREFEGWPNFPGNEEDLFMLCSKIIRKKLVTLTRRAVHRRLGASFDMGNALDWSKLDFATRRQKIEEILFHFLISLGGENVAGGWERGSRIAVAAIEKTPVLWCIHAIPAATSVAAARELGRAALYSRPPGRTPSDKKQVSRPYAPYRVSQKHYRIPGAKDPGHCGLHNREDRLWHLTCRWHPENSNSLPRRLP
jgi:hypothetical protein